MPPEDDCEVCNKGSEVMWRLKELEQNKKDTKNAYDALKRSIESKFNIADGKIDSNHKELNDKIESQGKNLTKLIIGVLLSIIISIINLIAAYWWSLQTI